MEEQRKLPIYTIEGTHFMVDVEKEVLIEKGNKENTISFSEMRYSRDGYYCHYNTRLKNIPVSFVDGYTTIHIPNMTALDPKGMSLKYSISEVDIPGKADIDIVIDQKQLALREHGQLPVIEISAHPFYVDLAMDSLRPKDDFTTSGIRFSDIDDYYLDQFNSYRIPYNPRTHTIADLDYDKIVAIPKGIIVIEIPLPQQLDPVAYARIHGFDRDQILMDNRLQMHRTAKEIPWEQTQIKQLIIRNLKQALKSDYLKTPEMPKRKKGKRI